MRRRWMPVRPERGDVVAAALVSGAVGLVVGAVTFYLTRTLLAREPLEPGPGRELPGRREERDGGRG